MLAGTKLRGEFEERIINVFKLIRKYDNPIIYIDEIHNRMFIANALSDWKWKEKGLQKKYDEFNAAKKTKYSCGGYATSGISVSREEYFYYPVLLGINRAVDWIAAMPDVDPRRFVYQGTSQGGGFGFYLCGLNRNFTRAALYVPAITDTMGYLAGRESGWPKIVESNSSTPERREAAEKWAPYFDGANFASRIRCPVRVAVGFSDTTCPPCAVYAAYNEILMPDKQILHGIGMTHSCFGKFYGELGRWLMEPPTAAYGGHAWTNQLFEGWYADPQIRLYGDTYWVFPTTSARFGEQTSFDAFSSKDMKTWTKHPRILTTNEVTWAKGALWAPDAHEVNGKTEFFRGCPPEWRDVSFENVALSNGRRVCGRRVDGKATVTFAE